MHYFFLKEIFSMRYPMYYFGYQYPVVYGALNLNHAAGSFLLPTTHIRSQLLSCNGT